MSTWPIPYEKGDWLSQVKFFFLRQHSERIHVCQEGLQPGAKTKGIKNYGRADGPVHFAGGLAVAIFMVIPAIFTDELIHFADEPAQFTEIPAHFADGPAHFADALANFTEKKRSTALLHRYILLMDRPTLLIGWTEIDWYRISWTRVYFWSI